MDWWALKHIYIAKTDKSIRITALHLQLDKLVDQRTKSPTT